MRKVIIIAILSIFVLSGCSIDETRVSNYKSAIGCELTESKTYTSSFSTEYNCVDVDGNDIVIYVRTIGGHDLRDNINDSIIVDSDVRFDIIYDVDHNYVTGISLHDRSE